MTPEKSCRTCKHAVAPNTRGCICAYRDKNEFHAGTEPCEHYRLDEIWRPRQ